MEEENNKISYKEIKAFQKKLGPLALELSKTKKIDKIVSYRELLQALIEVSQYQTIYQRYIHQDRFNPYYVFFGALIVLFISFNSGYDTFIMVCLAVAVISLLLAIIMQQLLNRLNLFKFGRHLKNGIFPTLMMLKDDVAENAQIRLFLDKTKLNSRPFFLRTINDPVRRPIRKSKSSYYKKNWAAIDIILKDKTKVQLLFNSSLRLRKRTKVNPRGKWKTKEKGKLKQSVLVKVLFSKQRYIKAPYSRNVLETDKAFVVKQKLNARPHSCLSSSVDLWRGGVEQKDILNVIFKAYKKVAIK